MLLCLLIPAHATAIPIYILFYKAGLLNTYASLILPFTISVFGIFLMRQFFMTVPDDLIDAARVDGMSELGIVWRVMLPTAVPALVAFGIFSVVAHWNDYFWPLIVVGDQALYTPPLGVAFFRLNDQGTGYGPLMAAATISIAPLVHRVPARAAPVHRGHHVHRYEGVRVVGEWNVKEKRNAQIVAVRPRGGLA